MYKTFVVYYCVKIVKFTGHIFFIFETHATFTKNYKKMKNRIYVTAIVSIILMSSCAKVYYSPDAEKISKKHDVIAVAIPKVSIPPQKNISADELIKMSEKEAEHFSMRWYHGF